MINKNQYELSFRQVCLFLIALVPVSKMFMMPSILAKHSNEDLWFSTLLNFSLDFITLFFVVLSCKNAKNTLFSSLEEKFGKTKTKIFFCFYLLYFLLKALVPINEQKDYVEQTLYTLTPALLYFCPFFLVAFFFCIKHLRVLGRTADVVWVSTVVGILIIFALSLGNMDVTSILPIGANGIYNVVKGSFSSFTWFGDAVYFMFFIGQFKFEKGGAKKILFSFIGSALAITLFTIIFYSVFTSIAFRQKFALTEISKYATVINNIGRFDYIGIMLILFSNMFSLSLPLFFASKLIGYIFNVKYKWVCALIVIGIQASVLIFFNQYVFTIENFVLRDLGVFFLLFSNVIPIIVSLLIKKENKNEVTIA